MGQASTTVIKAATIHPLMRGRSHYVPRTLNPETFREFIQTALPSRHSQLQDVWQPVGFREDSAVFVRLDAESLAPVIGELTGLGFAIHPHRSIQSTTDVIWLPRTTASLTEAHYSSHVQASLIFFLHFGNTS
eukprot:992426-Amphidinium_carterae.1